MQGLLLADSPATQTPPTEWAVIAIGLLTLIYAVFVRPLKKKKQKKDPLEQMPGNSMLAQQRAIERDMTALLVEYEQMMRTMTTQLETRVAKLEILLQDADRTITTLRAERDAARSAPVPPAAPIAAATGDPAPAIPEPKLASPAPVVPIPAMEAPPPTPPAKAEPAAEAEFIPAAPQRPAQAPLEPIAASATSSHEQIYAMADQGLDISQIARRLGQQYGEVELILALRPRESAEDDHPQRIERVEPPRPREMQAAVEQSTSAVATLPHPPAARPQHHGKHKKRHR